MRNAVFVVARLHSSRLPRKMLIEIDGKHVIEHVFERSKRVLNADFVVLCTTDYGEDDILCDIANRYGILCFRGENEDKMKRLSDAAKKYSVDNFVMMNGENILCDPRLNDIALEQLVKESPDVVDIDDKLPVGSFTSGFKASAVHALYDLVDTTKTEMMLEFFKARSDLFKIEPIKGYPECLIAPDIRMTMDYYEDILFFEKVISEVGSGAPLRVIIEFLRKHPEIVDTNKHLSKTWRQNQLSLANVKFKREA